MSTLNFQPDENATKIQLEDLSKDALLALAPRDDQGRPTLGRIPLFKRLGRGGMGAVYFGVHPRLQVRVAVKVLSPELVEQDPRLVDRFISEARIAAALWSDYVVRVLDVDREGTLHYLVMEYIHGETAWSYLKRRREAGGGIAEEEALSIVTAAARGLALAHQRGIVHRDVKPHNILIPEGQLGRSKLCDLGLAKPQGGHLSGGTLTSIALGTPGFMAPEQAQDAKNVGPAADVFSMGTTLFALLTGDSPFAGSNPAVVLRNTVEKEHHPLPGRVSRRTKAFVDRCLAKDPAQRFATGVELLAALEAPTPPEDTAVRRDRQAAWREQWRAAEVARTKAEVKRSVSAWQEVVDACAEAEEHAPGEGELAAVRALARLALQQRSWIHAREAESAGDLGAALELAERAAEAGEPPRELAELVASLRVRKQEGEARAARKREFDQWAAHAREEKQAEVALRLWKQAQEYADDPADVAAAKARLAELAEGLVEAEAGKLHAAAMAAARSDLEAGRFGEAAARFREALSVRADPEAQAGLAKAEEGRRQKDYDSAAGRAASAERASDWDGAKRGWEEALALRPSDERAASALREVEKRRRPPVSEIFLDEARRVRLDFVLVKPATWRMGDSRVESATPHDVTLTRAYWVQTTPVTQAQWEAAMGANPSRARGADLPVEGVSWLDAQEFLKRLNTKFRDRLKGRTAALPTEAEWEHACRAGSSGEWFFGDDPAKLGEHAWYADNSGGRTRPVGQRRPNAWGLFDLHGNVMEWCADWFGPYAGRTTDPGGPPSGKERCLRGGGFDAPRWNTRSAARLRLNPKESGPSTGLRLVLR